jgi:hypothetical protein
MPGNITFATNGSNINSSFYNKNLPYWLSYWDKNKYNYK